MDTVAEEKLRKSRVDSFVARHFKNFFVDDFLDTTPSTESELQAYIENELDPDSLLHLLMHSEARIVHFSDRFSDVELVYAIAVNDVEKRVLAKIRGTVNLRNWMQNLKSDLEYTPNPIVEDYPGKEDTIEMHGGYYEYLLRRRRDNGLRKYDEIAAAISDLLRGKRANYRCVVCSNCVVCQEKRGRTCLMCCGVVFSVSSSLDTVWEERWQPCVRSTHRQILRLPGTVL